MPSVNKNTFLIIYGFCKMTLGISTFVALCGGYFLKEWILVYPAGVTAFLFDQELIAVTTLAVVFRSIFHLVTGILLVRLNSFVKSWVMFGWPLLSIITFGVVYIYFEQWHQVGAVSSLGAIISVPIVLAYVGVMIFDIFLTANMSNQESDSTTQKEISGVSWKQIILSLVIILVVMSLVLFLGKPIQKGFHQGFYKTTGNYEPAKLKLVAEPKMVASDDPAAGNLQTSIENLADEGGAATVTVKQTFTPEIKEDLSIKEVVVAPKTQIAQTNEGFSYVSTIGWLMALCFILAVVFNLVEQPHLSSVLLSLGFLMMCVYGMFLQFWSLVFAGAISGAGFLVGIFYKNRL